MSLRADAEELVEAVERYLLAPLGRRENRVRRALEKCRRALAEDEAEEPQSSETPEK